MEPRVPPTLTQPPVLRRLSVLLATGACATVLAACGGGDDDTSTSTASSGSGAAASSQDGDQDAGRVRLQQCLRENSVDIPDQVDGGAPPADLDTDALQAALDGPCKDLQQGAFGDQTDEDRQEQQDALAEFTSCMRDEGVEVPDLTQDGALPDTGDLDLNDPDVRAAQEKCSDLLPQGGPGGGAGEDAQDTQ